MRRGGRDKSAKAIELAGVRRVCVGEGGSGVQSTKETTRKGVCYGSGEDVRWRDRGGNHPVGIKDRPVASRVGCRNVTGRFGVRVWCYCCCHPLLP